MERTTQAIAGMKDEATASGVAGITAVGTMGLRTAAQQPGLPRHGQRPLRSRDRSHLGRGRRAPGLSGGPIRNRPDQKARWSSSTPAAAALSSPSAGAARSTASSASTWVPFALPSDSGWITLYHQPCCSKRSTPSPQIFIRSTAPPRPTHSSAWAARSPISPP